MRIISGEKKGKKISPPKNLLIRPTTDKAKEALFNIITNIYDITNCNILDIYSGSGNISYEFASRGAKKIISVDSNRNCIKFIDKIAKDESFPITTFQCKAEKFLEKPLESFAIIFADPPYKYSVNNYKYLIEKVLEKKLLKENGIIIIEHDKKKDLSVINRFKEVRNYGGCCFSFFE